MNAVRQKSVVARHVTHDLNCAWRQLKRRAQHVGHIEWAMFERRVRRHLGLGETSWDDLSFDEADLKKAVRTAKFLTTIGDVAGRSSRSL